MTRALLRKKRAQAYDTGDAHRCDGRVGGGYPSYAVGSHCHNSLLKRPRILDAIPVCRSL
jgi:hypothetical protein